MNLQELKCCYALMERHSAELIEKVKELTENRIKRTKDDGKRQFTDIMEAAKSASCIEEFQLYISYKKAKGKGRDIWSNLAIPLNSQIDQLGEIADKILLEAKQGYGIALEKAEVHLELLKKYTGYLMWQANVLLEQSQ